MDKKIRHISAYWNAQSVALPMLMSWAELPPIADHPHMYLFTLHIAFIVINLQWEI